jgi:hypothetical protein
VTDAWAIARARSRPARVLWVALAVAAALGCGKKKEEDQTTSQAPPPPRGAASGDELTTLLGSARGIDEGLAPTSVRWTRVYALDDKRALIAGELVNETIALLTDDGGATWRSLKSERDAWSTWGVAMDGTVVLGAGGRDGAPTPTTATLTAARLAFGVFGAFDGTGLTAPTPLFATAQGPLTGLLQTDSIIPAVLSSESAAVIGSDGPKSAFLYYGGKPGAEAAPPLKLPGSEKVVPVPYGRPPSLLSIKGKDLVERPVPAAGKPLDKPIRVPAVIASPGLLAELSAPPACETEGWSFQKTKQPKGLAVIGVSQSKTVLVPLPDATAAGTKLGCGGGRLVVETIAPKAGAPSTWATQPDRPSLASCDLAGKCVQPQNAPFRLWPEAHKREIVMTSTENGVLAVLTARAGDRWGLYLAQGPGAGEVYERQRVIGEGQSDRGRLELGALVSLGKRAILLLSADVTGTSRRGWFVLVSDDGGTNWGPP